MTAWQPGDRVRVHLPEELPRRARYGMVAAAAPSQGEITVIVSDDDGSVRHVPVPRHLVGPLEALTIELCLPSPDLATDWSLRSGLAELWRAEALRAGVVVGSWQLLGTPPGAGLMASSDAWVVAEFVAGGEQLVLGVSLDLDAEDPVSLRAHRPHRWEP